MMSARALRARCRFLAEERCARRLSVPPAGACKQDRQGVCHLCVPVMLVTSLFLHKRCKECVFNLQWSGAPGSGPAV